MSRIAPVTITEAQASDIESYARGMDRESICHIFYRTYDSLTEDEKRIFEICFARGRALGQNTAIQCLFHQMGGKEGIKGALAYLIRFAKEWPNIEDEGAKNGQHSFKIVFPKGFAND